MKIRPEEIKRISSLAKLEYDHQDLEKFQKEFQVIIDFVSALEEISLEVEENTTDYNLLRKAEDKVQVFDNREVLINNAPGMSGSCFLFPSAINGDKENE